MRNKEYFGIRVTCTYVGHFKHGIIIGYAPSHYEYDTSEEYDTWSGKVLLFTLSYNSVLKVVKWVGFSVYATETSISTLSTSSVIDIKSTVSSVNTTLYCIPLRSIGPTRLGMGIFVYENIKNNLKLKYKKKIAESYWFLYQKVYQPRSWSFLPFRYERERERERPVQYQEWEKSPWDRGWKVYIYIHLCTANVLEIVSKIFLIFKTNQNGFKAYQASTLLSGLESVLTCFKNEKYFGDVPLS